MKKTNTDEDDSFVHADSETGMPDSTLWSQLSGEEQQIIGDKLAAGEGQSAQEAFDALVSGSGARTEAVLSLKNLIDATGGHHNAPIWQQIEKIIQISGEGSLLHLVVSDKFLEEAATALDTNGNREYVVNDYWDKKFATHDYNSIRQTTEYSGLEADKPACPLHLANDLGGNIYFAHFDSASAYFRTSRHRRRNPLYRLLMTRERIEAARIHRFAERRATASQVRDYLRSIGKIPPGEG